MPLKTVDVAIGVVFLYLLLTFAASAMLEFVSTALNWRAKMLYDVIARMLQGSNLLNVEAVYQNPLVVALGRDDSKLGWTEVMERVGWRSPKTGIAPSYIPAAIFSAVVLEGLMQKPVSAVELTPDGMIKTLSDRVAAQTDTNALLSVLRTTLASQGPSIQALRLAIEKWFNDTMDRASGGYKRRTQTSLLVFGLLIAFGGNVDTIAVSRWLWQGDAARQTVLSAAEDYAKKNNAAPAGAAGATGAAAAAATQSLTTLGTQVAQVDRQISDLQYPIGLPPKNSIPQYLCGALLTAIAISMGSTFWFDALQNLIKIRGAGPKPASR